MQLHIQVYGGRGIASSREGWLGIAEKQGSEWAEWIAEGVSPPVFYKRVRNRLILNGLAKYSFLKSAQEIEMKELHF